MAIFPLRARDARPLTEHAQKCVRLHTCLPVWTWVAFPGEITMFPLFWENTALGTSPELFTNQSFSWYMAHFFFFTSLVQRILSPQNHLRTICQSNTSQALKHPSLYLFPTMPCTVQSQPQHLMMLIWVSPLWSSELCTVRNLMIKGTGRDHMEVPVAHLCLFCFRL